ncbi:hypothetical protein QM012_006945 [Aureobasidium pullulans]|uniref:DNA replication checkpoint mediator MRC1 domain-containing protein n=1 Tax=Aureobasidium pullulans TaxID=5580 RepID=A0ABR0TRH1_AURPU
MPPIRNWFKSKKPLHVSRKAYYEDIFGEKNPEENQEGVHILDSESDSDTGFFSRRERRQGRKKHESTFREKNKEKWDRGGEMRHGDGVEIFGASRGDGGSVVMADDESDVGEGFVAELREHAQNAVNDENEDNIEVNPESNQDEMDPAFLAQVKKYAAQPPAMDNRSNDELLERINRRAESFANQSPLGPKKRELNTAAVLPSTEQPDDERVGAVHDTRSVTEAADEPSSTAALINREHSWDPSQGSNYDYSDEEVETGNGNANAKHGGLQNDANSDEEFYNASDEDQGSRIGDAAIKKTQDDTHDEEQLTDNVQKEMSDRVAERMVDSQGNYEGQEIIDLTSPTQFSSDEEPPIRRTRSSRPSTYNVGDHDPSTSLGRDDALTRTKKRPFGLFASNTSPDLEAALDELSDDEPPQMLRDLVERRAREREAKKLATKKIRYNLRPRRQQSIQNNAPKADKLMAEGGSEAEEFQKPRRMTRSMTAKTTKKKPIPRFKAARKSAWSAMGINPKDDTYQRGSCATVEVIIPAIVSRSTWGPTQLLTPSPQRESPDMNRDLFTPEGDHNMPHALAGRGIKRNLVMQITMDMRS